MPSMSGIGNITMITSVLLEKVRSNRVVHNASFSVATAEFRKQALIRLDRIRHDLESGQTPSLYIDLPVPEQHLKDYDRAIRMLQDHTNSTIDLDEQGYMRLVDDVWNWSD